MMKIFEEYKIKHSKYFKEECEYVYGSCDNWIIVFEKLADSVTNENRNDVIDEKYAEYIADKLKVVLIISKFHSDECVNEATYLGFCQIINYKVNEIIIKKSDYRLHYFKSVEPAFFEDLMNDEYTGFFASWFDNGLLSEKGFYINGLRDGIWTFGEIRKTSNTQMLREEKYSEGKIIPMKTENNYEMIKWIPPIQMMNSDSSFFYMNFYWLSDKLSSYIDPYLPSYLKINKWLKKE